MDDTARGTGVHARHAGPLPPALTLTGTRPAREPRPPVEPPRAAVVLAAGRGLRMRSSHPKALRRVGGISLLERTVRVLTAVGIDRILVVVGYRGEDVCAAVEAKRLPVEVVTNQDWERGTGSSVLAGLRALGVERCLVVMADHVFEPDDVRRVLHVPAANVLGVDRDPRREVGGMGGVPPTRVRIGPEGRVRALGRDLTDYHAVSAGLTVVRTDALLAVAKQRPNTISWLGLRQAMLEDGCEIMTADVGGLWADVDTPEMARALERAMWRRYGPKPTDGIVNRLFTRRISGPLTRLLLRTGITPDTATIFAAAVTFAAAGLVATGNRWLMLAGGLGVILGFALDGVDGELARVSGRSSRRGAVLDTLIDRYADLAVVLGLVLGSGATATGWAWGLAAAAGCLLVSYVHAVGRDTDVRLLFRREFRLLIFAAAAVAGEPLWGLVAVAVAANVDVVRGIVLLLRAIRG